MPTAVSEFDEAERRIWAGRAEAFRDSFAKLCAHTAPALLDAVGAGPGVRLLDVGTGSGTVAAAACARGAASRRRCAPRWPARSVTAPPARS